jgi:hypothetical protein
MQGEAAAGNPHAGAGDEAGSSWAQSAPASPGGVRAGELRLAGLAPSQPDSPGAQAAGAAGSWWGALTPRGAQQSPKAGAAGSWWGAQTPRGAQQSPKAGAGLEGGPTQQEGVHKPHGRAKWASCCLRPSRQSGS